MKRQGHPLPVQMPDGCADPLHLHPPAKETAKERDLTKSGLSSQGEPAWSTASCPSTTAVSRSFGTHKPNPPVRLNPGRLVRTAGASRSHCRLPRDWALLTRSHVPAKHPPHLAPPQHRIRSPERVVLRLNPISINDPQPTSQED